MIKKAPRGLFGDFRIIMSIDVIIPTYKPKKGFIELLLMLKRQTVLPDRIIVINTDEDCFREFEAGCDDKDILSGIEISHIKKEEFDHGHTRNTAMHISKADICIMMTMDALPKDEYLIENLVEPLKDERIAASYARQLAYENSSITEKLTRQFNYPDKSIVKSAKDIESMQIKAFFCSNVCCAYNMRIFNELGGFVDRTIFNEDMIYAAKAIRAGYSIAYCAEACVYHSHEYSGREQFKRNFDNGVSHAQNPLVFEGVTQDGEGKRMVKSVLKQLLGSGHLFKALGYIYNCGCKYTGFKLGLRYEKLPKGLVRAFSSQREYFD